MASRSNGIFQFKTTLKATKPPVWRRIQVPGDYTFWDLHVAIQDSMGWLDSHLHQFEVYNPRKSRMEYIGIPEDELELLSGWKVRIDRFFTPSNSKGIYTYDFGDDWEHTIVLEKILPRDPQTKYPCCLAGRRKCPPEDCGGTWGYLEFLQVVNDPTHEEHASMLEWCGGSFDPDEFNPKEVVFDDPKERLRYAFGEE
ncbi:MAG: plasmid pRiA4b ORF-3 family protein [Candidatus Glassbacteria bacterium]